MDRGSAENLSDAPPHTLSAVVGRNDRRGEPIGGRVTGETLIIEKDEHLTGILRRTGGSNDTRTTVNDGSTHFEPLFSALTVNAFGHCQTPH